MLHVNHTLTSYDLLSAIERMWQLSATKIEALEQTWRPEAGAPVFTVQGRYTSRAWTDWTHGFQFGSALLQFDATGEERFLHIGREGTYRHIPTHITHTGVHDHGFNVVSTYGNLWRMMQEGRIAPDESERRLCELAIRCSGAVQASRWARTADGGGYIYSFNGPHSLFADTMRTLRVLALAHRLGQVLKEEGDRPVSLLERLVLHARTTARHTVYYGEGRDIYDVCGRVAHESLFNPKDGSYRCPSTQQGYSPFTTWTRGLAWVMLGFTEQLEFLDTLGDTELEPFGGREAVQQWMLRAAVATCDFYIENTPTDGIPYWDTGAPYLRELGGYLERPADPFNDHEPVDSSAAAIAAQGLMRLGNWLSARGSEGTRYWQAGLTVLKHLLEEPYLSTDEAHQGLLLHSVYHRPNGWDHIPEGRRIPCGEACLWGDYHLRELCLYVQRDAKKEGYYTFFGKG
ncbi:MAG: glycoside hydrolase family 88 protein [Armatimonadota bacterium]|nr:glycoside hydrolase family 88 protein [Armatimonadota bacterium]